MTVDPIDSDDPLDLRHEILRLRDKAVGTEARNEVLDDRIAELDDCVAARNDRIAELDDCVAVRNDRVAELTTENARLHADLARPPIIRIARRIASVLRLR